MDATPPPAPDGSAGDDIDAAIEAGAPRDAGVDGAAPNPPEQDGATGGPDDLDAQLPPADAAADAARDALAPRDAESDATSDAGGGADDASVADASSDDASRGPVTDDASVSDASVGDASVSDASVGDASVGDGGTTPTCSAATPPAVGQLALQTVISGGGLQKLTDAVQPPGSNDWYLVEQGGRVMVLRSGAAQLEPTPYLDLRSEISLPNERYYDDRGLVSIAFAPDYATSGRVYASVTPDQGDFANVDLLLEFTRSSEDAYRVDPASRRTVLEVRGRRLDSNGITVNIHNGGRVAFGPDGMLYLAMGDGGGINCGDVEPNATQDVSSLFGKMLRLDLSRPEPYGAADNPFVDSGDARVWHYGLRNPFRFSFDRLTGDLYLGDVGQTRYEELDFAPSGESGLNFGWAPYEGNSRETCPTHALRPGSVHAAPIFVVNRREAGPYSDFEAIIGGVVYRGRAIPELYGAYLFGGYDGVRLGALYQCGDQTSGVAPILKNCDPNQPNAACMGRLDRGRAFRQLRAIVEDHEGEIYMVANGDSLLKVVPAQ